MKSGTLLLLLSIMLNYGVGTIYAQKSEIIKSSHTTIRKGSASSTFDGSKPAQLKDQFLRALKERKVSTDKIVIKFLTAYRQVADNFTDSLYKRPDFEDLNTLAYESDGKVKQTAFDFKRKVYRCGLALQSSEGSLYVVENTQFIKEGVLEQVDPLSRRFLQLYCEEIDKSCCEDAGIVLPMQTIINRAFAWGELLDKVQSLAYKEAVNNEYKSYLSLVFFGQDNTPTFDSETGNFRQAIYNGMQKAIAAYPQSRVSKDFRNYCRLLQQEGFKQTTKIQAYRKQLE